MKHIPIIAVDFDGTLFKDAWPDVGDPIMENIEGIKLLVHMGCKIILWTCRVKDKLEDALLAASAHGLEFDAVNENLPEVIEEYGFDSRKITATVYFDNKASFDIAGIIGKAASGEL